ncbi:MAG: rRNA maturation RNase YbeY [Thermoguttaceae bacterium]
MTDVPRELIIEVNDEQSQLPEDRRLVEAVRTILEEASIPRARISVAVVDDPTIHRLHRDYLQIDEPTDVMSFVLEHTDDLLEGEVIASADTAVASAPQFGMTASDELLLYVIHGTLHLVGFDDVTPEKQAEMRRQERAHLARFDVDLPDLRTAEKEGDVS